MSSRSSRANIAIRSAFVVIIAVPFLTPAAILTAAASSRGLDPPMCFGREATIVGTIGDDQFPDAVNGTTGNDVIHALAGHDAVYALGLEETDRLPLNLCPAAIRSRPDLRVDREPCRAPPSEPRPSAQPGTHLCATTAVERRWKTTVAVRGTSRSNAISPNSSPGPSVPRLVPARETFTSPAAMA